MHISARNPNRKNAHKGGSGPLISKEYSYTVETGQPHYVLDIPKLTNTPSKSIKNISQTTNLMETLQLSILPDSPTSTSSLEDSPAKHLVLLESGGDLTTPEELYSLTSQGFSKKNNQETSYWKMSKDCYLMTEEELSKPLSPRLLNWGIVWNGKCLTQRISESHRIGKECSLSDILEEQVDQKYFLSEKATENLKKYLNLTIQDIQTIESTEQMG